MTSTLPRVDRPRAGHAVAEVVTGIVLVVMGGLAAAAAIGLLAVFGTSGRLDSGAQQLTTSSTALVSDVARIGDTRGVGAFTGSPTLRVTAGPPHGSSGVFIGIGPAADVDRYLAGAATDEVTDLTLTPFGLSVRRHGGSAIPAPPESQPFWVASAGSPTTADLIWQLKDGDYRIVVMNADGSPAVATPARLRLTLPNAFPVSLAVLAGSAVTVLGGAAVVTHGLVRRRRPGGDASW